MTTVTSRTPGSAVADYVTTRAGLAFAGARETSLRESLDRALEAEPTLATVPLESDAFARLCDFLTVQESFFFREPAKLVLLRDRLLGKRSDARPLRVWSAGCAAGEEAYTLAAVLHAAGFAGRYTVLGTDLSGAAVAAAREATYGPWALRDLDDREVSRIFTREDHEFRVRSHLRRGVEFLQHNLLEPLPPEVGTFDVVFCRNLLIYLTPDAVTRAASMLAASLAPGGWLVTGVSDPVLDHVGGLETVLTAQGVAYQRAIARPRESPQPAPAPAPLESPATGVATRPARGSSVDAGELLARADHALRKAQPRAAERLARRVLVAVPRSREAHCLLVLALGQAGMLAESLEAAATAVAMFPADGNVHHLYAVMLLESGDVAGAMKAATRAVQLAPDLPSAHLLLARSHELLGHVDEARSSRRHGRQLIAAEIGSG